MQAQTLTQLMAQNRDAPRSITFHNGDNDSRSISFAQLNDRALGLLHHLQQRGAQPSDKVILLLGSNEQFVELLSGEAVDPSTVDRREEAVSGR